MPVVIEGPGAPGVSAGADRSAQRGPIRIGLINNMPDSALQSTEAQFGGLLEAAAAGTEVRLRLSSFAELPRSAEALEHIARSAGARGRLTLGRVGMRRELRAGGLR